MHNNDRIYLLMYSIPRFVTTGLTSTCRKTRAAQIPAGWNTVSLLLFSYTFIYKVLHALMGLGAWVVDYGAIHIEMIWGEFLVFLTSVLDKR